MGREEIKKVIEMVKEGKISPEEGERLILAIKKVEKEGKGKGRFLRISAVDEEDKVNIKIPLFLVRLASKFVPKESLSYEVGGEKVQLPLDEILEHLTNENYTLVEVESEDGSYVKIWIE